VFVCILINSPQARRLPEESKYLQNFTNFVVGAGITDSASKHPKSV
jgi:hypothetical protein